MLKYFANNQSHNSVPLKARKKTVKIFCYVHMRETTCHMTKIPATEFLSVLIFPSQKEF